MAKQIAQALNLDEAFITNVEVDGKHVSFDLNGVPYFAKLGRGKFNPENMRRASY
jgi:hypothetical protein